MSQPWNERPGITAAVAVTGVVILTAWLEAASLPVGSALAIELDNFHWSVASVAAAGLMALGAREAGISSEQRMARRIFTVALALYAAGQVLWDFFTYQHWLTFAGIYDAFFVLLGPLFAAGFIVVLRKALPPQRLRLLALDVGSFALAVLALAFSLYLPHSSRVTALEMTVYVAYPVFLFSAAALAVVMQLHLRQRWSARFIALCLALWGEGAIWLSWNLQELNQVSQFGSLTSLGFSVFSLVLAWGAAGWRCEAVASPSYDRICEGILRLIPLSTVAMAAVSVWLLTLNPDLDSASRTPLIALSIAVFVLAVARQTQQLAERDRLVEAEHRIAESQARFQHLAQHDALTGLPNQDLLRDRVEQALQSAGRHGHRVALLFIDLDHFKEVNDTLGHAAGDALLRHVAGQLQLVTRPGDTVSRQGGDEFTIVLSDLEDWGAIVRAAEKVMEVSASSTRLDDHELPLSMSIGIAVYPEDAREFNSLLRCADTAMYRAKAAGRHTYRFYDAIMHADAAQRIRLRAGLARAIERGELALHYQPLIDLRDGSVRGAEALLRWTSRELGPVPPSDFIPAAEHSGLIVDIGGWVLREACRQAADWQLGGLDIGRIAVNVSVLQFRRGDLENQVLDALRASGLPGSGLELEVTESVLMQDQDRVLATLRALGEMGVGIAIDDFGTGYSSLQYLQRMSVGRLKIDRTFVHSAVTDSGTAAIVRAMVEMARSLKVDVVAEGVETSAQLDFLKINRCQIGQGYLFARPMPAQELERFLRQARSSVAHG
jgi:diguanylate cyclase (GGDEF)-like protein